ncbi:peptidoglycan/LPS O-acetylase OafA/YrhL [Duganella sp. 1411]|jgi:peptidoglycan/LPS O-acetylase OafA/YrhL|uniref:acyltransferase family protein n=1 Tax=Duganella sp. 1411 TaxID=2806572 RepID=UPI001AE1CAA8|nr:acyltransferase [Duganella sp. 1411]MBP1206767.1 peptidoglycan/LPS O-acetylase OafA/YrhL [Duganella sp. 1411]
MNRTNNLEWVQLLRGVAALLVVLAHGRYALLGSPAYPLADQLLGQGGMGVDLFFIISGFIMCYSTAGDGGGPAATARFLIKRVTRVWPVYAVATLLSVFVLYGGAGHFHSAANRWTFWHTLAMLPADPRAAPYFSLTLPVAWTLEFEMYFYLLFAASLLFRRWRWVALATWVLVTVVALPQLRGAAGLDVGRDLGYRLGYMTIVSSPYVLEFAAGAAIGWLYLQDWARLRNGALARHVLGLGTAFAVWAIYGGVVLKSGPAGYGWPLALMLLCMALASKTVPIRVPALWMWLGSISYSLYLTHLLSQSLFGDTLVKLGIAQLSQSWPSLFMSTALALSVAALSHRYLELGLATWCRERLLKLVPERAARPVEDKDKVTLKAVADR